MEITTRLRWDRTTLRIAEHALSDAFALRHTDPRYIDSARYLAGEIRFLRGKIKKMEAETNLYI